MKPVALNVLLVCFALALGACDSAEERAEKHFQSGLELLEQGDVDRALVELRNVFKLNGQHREARLTYARVQRERGELSDAYSQYLRLVEQYPDDVEGRRALAEMAIEVNDWNEVERHGREAARLNPDDPMTQMIVALLDYRSTMLAGNRSEAEPQVEKARALLEAHPEDKALSKMAYRVLIDYAISGADPQSAMPTLDTAIALDPMQIEWQMIKLRLLVDKKDQAAIGEHLSQMYEHFPENEEIRTILTAWYLDQRDMDGAEAFLRRLAEDTAKKGDAEATLQARLTVVQFIQQTKGAEAAIAELDSLIAAETENRVYKATRAAMVFDSGKQDEAIASLEALLEGAPEDAVTNNVKVALARFLVATGNNVGARSRIEEVLAVDPSHVAALKMKAAWLIDEDRPGEAIIALRTALDQAPRDADILTMMGAAHERDGARNLAGERYALAVEASGKGAAESLRYAQFLLIDDRQDAALIVLDDAIKISPRDKRLLLGRAELLISMSKWEQAAQAVADLRALGTKEAIEAANTLQANLLLRQEKVDETVTFLESLSGTGDADRAAIASVVQARVRAGEIVAARDYVDQLLVETPDDPILRFLRAGIHLIMNEPEPAEKIYRELLEKVPDNTRVVQALYSMLQGRGRVEEATSLLKDQIAKKPESVTLNLMLAGELEKANDIDGAIAVYEQLYAKDTGNLIIANNLASLISSHRADDQSLERAFAIARRLRGSDVPAFQDTYGWIEYRRGNLDEALENLEPAAKGLPDDPLTQYHLGMVYLALERKDDAKATLSRAVELAGDSPLPQFEDARKALQGLANP